MKKLLETLVEGLKHLIMSMPILMAFVVLWETADLEGYLLFKVVMCLFTAMASAILAETLKTGNTKE